MKRTVLLGLSLAAVLILASTGSAYDRWQLDLEAGQPKSVVVRDALGKGTPYLYIPFKVTNNSGKERDLRISIRAISDTKKRVEGEEKPIVMRAIFNADALKEIQRREKKKFLSMGQMMGKIADGETKEAVAIFPNPDAEMDRMVVRVYGLVDPIDVVMGKRYYELKVLSLEYERPGDEFGHVEDAIKFVKKQWVVEGERREIPSAQDK